MQPAQRFRAVPLRLAGSLECICMPMLCVCVCAAHCNLGHRAASPACEASRDEDFALNSQRNLDEQHGATCMRHDTGMLSSHHSRLTFEAQPKPSGCHSLPWFVTLDLGVGSFDAVV